MHLGTVPGDMAKKLTLEQTKSTHTKLINSVTKFLESLKIKHEVLDRESFSYTNDWGVEFYGCLLITSTRKLVCGFGALFGLAFRQDAVGTFSCFTNDNDPVHGFFLVSRSSGSPMKTNEALNIMKLIHPCFPDLSAQRDPLSTAVEFHDYPNICQSITSDNVLQPILDNNPFNYLSYQSDKYGAKSFLVDSDHYDEAINAAGLQSYKFLIEMVQEHAKKYPKRLTHQESEV